MADSTTIVIFGATGDLARRKLIPSLGSLAQKGRLPDNLRIVGFSRSQYSDDQYRDYVWQGMKEMGVAGLIKRLPFSSLHLPANPGGSSL